MSSAARFLCTPAGAVSRSRRRLRNLLLGLALPMLAVAVWMVIERRFGAAFLSFGSSFLAWFGWRMSGDLDPFWLELDGDELVVQMRRRRQVLRLLQASCRLLDEGEIAYLHGLTSMASLIFSSASFDSQRLGEVELFATNLDKAVLVEVDDAHGEDERISWIVTPDDTEAFTRHFAESVRSDARRSDASDQQDTA